MPAEARLHSASYLRKRRGGPHGLSAQYEQRLSYSCAADGCRKRTTPPSVRFLRRKVGEVVVLVGALRQGPTPTRVRKLEDLFGVGERTLRRWRPCAMQVGLLSRPHGHVADFYRELGELFGVVLSPHNRRAASPCSRLSWRSRLPESRHAVRCSAMSRKIGGHGSQGCEGWTSIGSASACVDLGMVVAPTKGKWSARFLGIDEIADADPPKVASEWGDA